MLDSRTSEPTSLVFNGSSNFIFFSLIRRLFECSGVPTLTKVTITKKDTQDTKEQVFSNYSEQARKLNSKQEHKASSLKEPVPSCGACPSNLEEWKDKTSSQKSVRKPVLLVNFRSLIVVTYDSRTLVSRFAVEYLLR
jgi:hypothetical protein